MQKMIFLLLFFVFSPVNAAEGKDAYFPPLFTADYSLYAKGVKIGEGVRRLYREGDKYIFASESHAVGPVALFRNDTIVERSEFLRHGKQLRPLHYFYKHKTGKKVRRHREFIFDWDTRQARSVAPKRHWTLGFPANVLDNLLYQIMVMRDLKQGVKTLAYQVVDNGKVKTYEPEWLGEERVDTGTGLLNTLKYRWVSPDNKHRVTTFWCAPKYHYLLAQVEHVEKKGGTVLRLKLDSVEGLSN